MESNIVKGNVNDVLGLDKDIPQTRLNICYSCPLYSKKHGGICNNNLYLNPITGDVSLDKQPGYRRGCGCLLSTKVQKMNQSCPLDKW